MNIPSPVKLWVDSGKAFLDDDVPQAAAALSFYAVAALPPMVVILVSMLGLVYSDGSASDRLGGEIAKLFGPSASDTIMGFLSTRSSSHGVAALGSVVVLLFGAAGFFGQLQKAINNVWGVRPKPSAGFKVTIKKRLLSMTAVLGTGFLLLISLALSAFIAAAGQALHTVLGIGPLVSTLGESLATLILITGLFALIFKVLPDVDIAWSDVWHGAFTTALLFLVGKLGLGWYLGRTDFSADYGSAGALVLILFWVYYSSMILLFGAELTQTRALAQGRDIEPEPYAELFELRAIEPVLRSPETQAPDGTPETAPPSLV